MRKYKKIIDNYRTPIDSTDIIINPEERPKTPSDEKIDSKNTTNIINEIQMSKQDILYGLDKVLKPLIGPGSGEEHLYITPIAPSPTIPKKDIHTQTDNNIQLPDNSGKLKERSNSAKLKELSSDLQIKRPNPISLKD